MGPKGWYTRDDNPREKTPFHYIKGGNDFDDPEPDDELDGIRGKGRTATLEWLQWSWINKWDERLSGNSLSLLDMALKAGVNHEIDLKELNKPDRDSEEQWEMIAGGEENGARPILVRRRQGGREQNLT